MTTITKLSIRGVRSFGCEREDEQKIEFRSPLSLIVGQNGCGKTTIIECLKYALTGDKPPGTNNGLTFVHDPKISRSKVSMAQVKLSVTNLRMVRKTVVRSMKCELMKGGKSKFTTLDSTICTEDPVRGRDDVTGRVEDINNNMCEFMGVSKAIINNVIFCHQEDSNWPLDEGKKLKEKFDSIFGTTEYNKAIERIIKIRKNFQTKLVETEGDKKLSEEIKMQAEKKERELSMLKNQCDKVQDLFKKAADDLVPLEKRKDEIMDKERNYNELAINRLKLKNTVVSKSDDYNALKAKLKRPLQGSVEQLEQQKLRFIEDQNQKKKKMEQLEMENKDIGKKERDLQSSVSGCEAKAEGITEKICRMQDLSSDRFEKVRDICAKLSIAFDGELDQSMDSQQITSSCDDIKRRFADDEDNIMVMKVEIDEKDQEFQKKIDKLRDERTKLETHITAQSKSIESIKDNQRKIKDEIKSSEASIPMLSQLNPKILKAEQKLQKLNDENNISDLKDNQDIAEADKMECEDKLACIEVDIDILQSVSKITGELELKRNDLSRDQKEFDRIKNKLAPTFRTLFGAESPDTNYRMKVTKKKESLESEVRSMKEELQKLQRDDDRMTDRRVNLRRQLETRKSDLKKIQDNIDDVCKGNDYKDYLASQKEKVAKLSMELAVLQSSKNTYNDYIQKIDADPCCPLCHKDFDLDETESLKVEIQENIQGLPKKIDAAQKKLSIETKIHDKLNSYKSSFDSINKYTEEINTMDQELKKIDEKLKENAETKESLEDRLAKPETNFSLMSSSFLADVYKLDDLQRTVMNKKKEVEAISVKLPKNIPKKSLDEAQSERKKFTESIKAQNETIKKLNDEIKSYHEKLMNVREELNSLKAEKNKYQEKMQGLDRLKEQMKQLEKDHVDCEQKLKESQTRLIPIKNILQKTNEEKQEAREKSQKNLNEFQKKLTEMERDIGEIDRLNREIISYHQMNLENQLAEQKALVARHKETIKGLVEKYNIKLKEINSIRDDISNQETTHRNLIDNIDLLKIEKQKNDAIEELKNMDKNIGDLDLNKMRVEKKTLLAEIEKLINDKAMMSGKLSELRRRLKEAVEEMDEDKYKNAKKRYMKAVNEVCVYKATIEDLNKYRMALERSLLKFHQDKMDQINHLLRDLWNNIYKGNDIDYIIIKTDEEDAKVSASDKKRSYNYRVVQCKNGQEIDMRGRCSAGQKVLASLIIRIALADVFSANCGILALDEPTTNLDSKNINSLCTALAQIVRERDDGSGKFMLLIITHDEDFANALERAEHYYKVSRDIRGCSRIEKFNNY